MQPIDTFILAIGGMITIVSICKLIYNAFDRWCEVKEWQAYYNAGGTLRPVASDKHYADEIKVDSNGD